jgi:2-polyprenyl-3-methyl-5-hydroxy-6-metoxy-1,4-benzoquinol methylase
MIKNCLFVDCPLCGVNDYRLRYSSTVTPPAEANPGNDSYMIRDLSEHGDIVQCRQCGMIYNNPQPEPAALLSLYTKIADPGYLKERQSRELTFKGSLVQLHKFSKPPGKLLDIGCFTGMFMYVAAKEGWDVAGLELSSWAANIARNASLGPIYEQPLEQLQLPENHFDVITLWDVIEHLTNPADTLAAAYRLLKPGGIIAFSTHMIDSLPGRIWGKHYPFFMAFHLVHFSRTTITRMLHEQGYRLLSIKPHHRMVRTGYLLENWSGKMKNPLCRSFIKQLSTWNRLADVFIKTKFLGLVNIYARKQ